ncbi:DUF6452 family protein [Zeaxanthinibacter enoshimensis]|uniref:Uncharacterized protein n=1 Tax=Zeaxanthinibacter enoshimensis TaxID=392009 RepID=A0A4R6TM72_9FLAO|nr:DUF6452 family protein [Zeaxanthinibacter enoshimensis]TDQ31662.1 hypothetical protein CLV82_2371 [Zeaxanthinibacter enoshimensis]
MSNKTSQRLAAGVLLSLLCIISFNACEKDDICVDGNTPLLVVTFYDLADSTTSKDVNNLRIIGLEQGQVVNTFSDRSVQDSIGLPLRINNAETRFIMIKDSADENEVETGNRDTITLSYDTEEVFVSRACGFIANFNNLNAAVTADTDNWIQEVLIEQPTVTNQNTTHVKIYH